MNGSRSFFVLVAIWIGAAVAAAPINSVFAQSDPNAGVAAAVQSYFANIPVMAAIAKCESGPRQFAANGAPLYAGTDDLMVGVFQIDSSVHTAPALALGFDITTLAGNLGYARYLYAEEGTEPWISSFGCWGASTDLTSTSSGQASTSTPALTLTLSLGDINPQVLILQQLLNKTNFTVAASGPGSPGNETMTFGALTYAALKKFQCAEGIVCSGDEATTGYGLLNAATRTALLAITASPVTTTATSTATAATPTIAATSAAAIVATDAAEVASLQSRIVALAAIVDQLETQIAGHIGQ